MRRSALKYTGAFVDVATSGGGEIAANASVIKVEGSTVKKPIGTPSVIAYFVQGAYAEPYAKVVLRDMKEAGPVSGRAGKDSKSGVGRDALAALRIRHEAIATLTKKLSGEVERRGLALDAKGCYLKQKSAGRVRQGGEGAGQGEGEEEGAPAVSSTRADRGDGVMVLRIDGASRRPTRRHTRVARRRRRPSRRRRRRTPRTRTPRTSPRTPRARRQGRRQGQEGRQEGRQEE